MPWCVQPRMPLAAFAAGPQPRANISKSCCFGLGLSASGVGFSVQDILVRCLTNWFWDILVAALWLDQQPTPIH